MVAMPRLLRYGEKAVRIQAFVHPQTAAVLEDWATNGHRSVGEVIDALVRRASAPTAGGQTAERRGSGDVIQLLDDVEALAIKTMEDLPVIDAPRGGVRIAGPVEPPRGSKDPGFVRHRPGMNKSGLVVCQECNIMKSNSVLWAQSCPGEKEQP